MKAEKITENFIILKPKRQGKIPDQKLKEIVRFSFVKNKKYHPQLIIRIGINLAEKLKLNFLDKIVVSYDKNNVRRLLLKKSDSDFGYTLTSYNERNGKNSDLKFTALRISLTFELLVPSEEDFCMKTCEHEIIGNDLLITL